MDYSNSQVIATETGQSKLVIGTFKILHVIDLEQYNKILTTIEETIKKDITRKDASYTFLLHELNSSLKILDELRPKRSARSIDALGTAWKWIAGTPDHEDFQIISDQTKNLLKNNQNQIVINKAIEERLQIITNMTNTVLNSIKTSDSLRTLIVKDVERKLKILTEELININYAIQWAKSGIVNSFILSNSELTTIRDFFTNQSLPYINLIEALEFAEVKISSSKNTLIFIVNLPRTENIICKNLFIRPVKKGNFVINIKKVNFILCKDSILEIKTNCKLINEISLCKRENVDNITDTECLPNLLSGTPSVCPTTNHHHLPTIEEVMPGLMLLNGYRGIISLDKKEVSLNGTFLVKFHNTTLTIGDKTYFSKEKTMARPLPAIVQSMNNVSSYEEVLSLKALKDLHVKNLEEIRDLTHKNKAALVTSLTFPTVIILGLIFLLVKKILARKQTLKIETVHVHSIDYQNHDSSNVDVGI